VTIAGGFNEVYGQMRSVTRNVVIPDAEFEIVSARKSVDFCTGQQLVKHSSWIQQRVCSEIE
jgi:hypothetical protein